MGHAITIGDILLVSGVGLGIIVVVGVLVAILAVVAKGFNH